MQVPLEVDFPEGKMIGRGSGVVGLSIFYGVLNGDELWLKWCRGLLKESFAVY